MITMKSYTDISQSKTLSKILPFESADMWYEDSGLIIPRLGSIPKEHTDTEVPCWSLTALLGILPNNKHIATTLSRGVWKIEPVEYIDKWFCEYEDRVEEYIPCKDSVSANNPVDACYEMIIKLHEMNLL